VAAVLTLLLGLLWILFPEAMLAGWGATVSIDAVYMSRRYATLFFGYALILWLARESPPSHTRRAVVAGEFVVTGLMAVLSLSGVLTSTINATGLFACGIEALLATGFGYFLFSSLEQPHKSGDLN
jgi:hypothetical protein